MTTQPLEQIETRVSANLFDPAHHLTEAQIGRLIDLATRAPTAYNLQNWRFVAVRSDAEKARLKDLANGQQKVADAAVTFVVFGVLPDAATLGPRLQPSVDAGIMPGGMATTWVTAAGAQYADPRARRDEAVRSASFGAAMLMQAAGAMGLASGPIGGFDAAGVAAAYAASGDEVPVVLVSVGRAAPGNWPQKPRRALGEVLEIA